jgi:hypothetical protein
VRKQQVEPGSNSVPLLDLLPGRLHCAADYNQPDSSPNSCYSWARVISSPVVERLTAGGEMLSRKLVHAAFRTISLVSMEIKHLPI